MKTVIQSICVFLVAFAMAGTLNSCTKDNLPNGGEPRITYIRVTNPVSSDSLLVGAPQGKLIAVMGENLGGAVEMWFNDQQASLNPTFITNTTILVNVPAQIPLSINNTMKINFKDGRTLSHNFEVQISKPVLSSMVSEYVNTGDIATIRGNFFYAPLTVTFTGGVTGEIASLKDNEIQVRVPAGAQPGPITVKTNFGETESDFWFRDNRNIFISSDPYAGWWRESLVVTNPGPDDPQKINGNYIRVNQSIGDWQWFEVAGGPASATGAVSKNIPDAAILKPSDYNFKFEVNTKKPYTSNLIKFNIGLPGENNNGYTWAPPYDTKGQWQTVVIPFEEVVASYKLTGPLTVQPNGYWSRILFHGGGALAADISFDNLRVVPKVIQ